MVATYTIITISISIANICCFTTDEFTKAFYIMMSYIYYGIKITIMVIKLEINGFIYNKIYDFFYYNSNNNENVGCSDYGHLCPVAFNHN